MKYPCLMSNCVFCPDSACALYGDHARTPRSRRLASLHEKGALRRVYLSNHDQMAEAAAQQVSGMLACMFSKIG